MNAPLDPAWLLHITQAELAEGGLADRQMAIRAADWRCEALADAMLAQLGSDTPVAEASAVRLVARAADASGVDNAFHNPAHSREVALNWWLLARLVDPRWTDAMTALGLLAAFGHDLGHDGGTNGSDGPAGAFRLETIAAAQTAVLMRRAGCGDPSCAAVEAMILATDVTNGHPALDRPGGDPRLAPLRAPLVLAAARMLRDADLIPSVAVSPTAYRERTRELEIEQALLTGSLTGAGARPFFDRVFQHRFLSTPAQALLPATAWIEASG